MLSRDERISRRVIVEAKQQPHGLLSKSFIELHEKYYGREASFRLFCMTMNMSGCLQGPENYIGADYGAWAAVPSARLRSESSRNDWVNWCFGSGERASTWHMANAGQGIESRDEFWRSSTTAFRDFNVHRLSGSGDRVDLFRVNLPGSMFNSDYSRCYNMYSSALVPFSSKNYITKATSVSFLRGLYGITSAGITSNEVLRGNISAEDFIDHLHTIASAAVICEEGTVEGTAFVDSISDEKQKFKEHCSNEDNWNCINRLTSGDGCLWTPQ